jgi:hypothetical protein
VRSVSGELKLGYLTFVNFRRGRLPFGARYRMEIVLTSKASTTRTTRLASRPLEVRPPSAVLRATSGRR